MPGIGVSTIYGGIGFTAGRSTGMASEAQMSAGVGSFVTDPAKACPSNTVRCVFYKSKSLVFTTTGFSATFGDGFLKVYSVSDSVRADAVRRICVCNLSNQEDTIAILCL